MEKRSLAAELDPRRHEKEAVTLYAQPCKVVAIYLPQGARLAKHVTPGAAVLFVHSGRVSYAAAGESVELAAGESVAIPAQVEHEVDAHEASELLLIR